MGRPACGFASRFRPRFTRRLWRPPLRGLTSPAGAGSAEQSLARSGAGGRRGLARSISLSKEEVRSLFPFSHTSAGEKPHEHYWWEKHAPTRAYLAPGMSRSGASQGTSGTIEQVNSQGGNLV